MVIWQAASPFRCWATVPRHCCWLPRPRRTAGSVATGVGFALLALLWLVYAGAFALDDRNGTRR